MYIAVIERGEHIIPVLKGGDGPDAECMATWETRAQAWEEGSQVPMAHAYPLLIIDMDDAT